MTAPTWRHFGDELRSNLAFAFRSAKQRALLSVTVVVTLMVGIGVTTGIFTVVDAVALRARVAAPASFVRIYASYGTDSTTPGFAGATQLSDYLAFRDGARSLTRLAGWSQVAATLGDDPARVPGLLVTCEFFDVYPVQRALAGRMLGRDDCDEQRAVTVISESLWRNRYASADVIGHAVRYNGRAVEIVGVAPTSFEGQINGAQLWIPYTARAGLGMAAAQNDPSTSFPLNLDGRLREGYSRADVRADVAVLAAAQDRLHPGRRLVPAVTDGSMIAKPANRVVGTAIIALVLAALACLALVACANVVSLVLARAHARQREMAVRVALGAGTGRLVRMLLTESLVLALCAGLAASILALRIPAIIIPWLTQRAVMIPVSADWRVFAFLVGLTTLLGIAAGLAPARASLDFDVVSALKNLHGAGRRGTKPRRRGMTLIAAQVGAALMLLAGGVVLMRTPRRLLDAPQRFETRSVLSANLITSGSPTDSAGLLQYHDAVASAVRSAPGVQAVAFGSAVPAGDERVGAIDVTFPAGGRRQIATIQVSPGYFDVFGLSMLRGRALVAGDRPCDAGVCSAVISRETARELWPNADALGQRLEVDSRTTLEVVGIVGDATSRTASAAEALMIYRPWAPASERYHEFVRFRGEEDAVARALVSALRARFPDAVVAPSTIQSSLDFMSAGFARMGLIVGVVATLAALLALVGVYGVVALAAAQRTKEIGIRVALGATRKDVHAAILATSTRPLAVGLAVGLLVTGVVAVVVDRLAGTALPTRLFDPVGLAWPALVLAGVAFAAVFAPARRAANADPLDALRQE